MERDRKVIPENWSFDCRRLFLRGWHPVAEDGPLCGTFVNVEIWVRYENSSANTDELEDVLDYNVMRDALLVAGKPESWEFVDKALAELMKAAIEAAHVELVCDGSGETWRGSRYARR